MTPEHPFDEPWQAQAFALVVALHEREAFSWSEWSDLLATALDAAPDRSYWCSWLAAMEAMMLRKGMAGSHEVTALALAWREAADRTPHGEPIVLDAP